VKKAEIIKIDKNTKKRKKSKIRKTEKVIKSENAKVEKVTKLKSEKVIKKCQKSTPPEKGQNVT